MSSIEEITSLIELVFEDGALDTLGSNRIAEGDKMAYAANGT